MALTLCLLYYYLHKLAYSPDKEAQPLELSQSFHLTMYSSRVDSFWKRNTTEGEFFAGGCSSENVSRNKDTHAPFMLTNF